LEAAKHLGYVTALVVTSTVTDATPAAFSAHVVDRDLESEIAAQQIGDYPLGRQVDLLFGGGRCFFLPNDTEGSCRTDERDLTKESKKKGFKYFSTRKEFDDLQAGSFDTLYFVLIFYIITHFKYINAGFLFWGYSHLV
jgi:alkaline phosphatase